jgi:hypothetical protein
VIGFGDDGADFGSLGVGHAEARSTGEPDTWLVLLVGVLIGILIRRR